jgi:hypothetical protein
MNEAPMTEDSPGHEGRFLATVLGHGAARPDDAALTCGPVTIGWGRLREEVLAAAGAISKVCGPEVGNVALLGTPSVPMVLGYLGAIAGAYLGKKLSEYVSDAYGDAKNWISRQWDKVSDKFKDAAKKVWNYLTDLF